MEPFTLVRNVTEDIVKSQDGIILEGSFPNFDSLKDLLTLRKIDLLFTEIYDKDTSISEGLDFLKKIKSQYPLIDMIILSDINLPGILMQSNADAIYTKKVSIENFKNRISNALNTEHSASLMFYDERIRSYNFEMLNDLEWGVFLLLSKQMSMYKISKKYNMDYKKVSRLKRSIIKKLQLDNSTHLSKIMAIMGNKLTS